MLTSEPQSALDALMMIPEKVRQALKGLKNIEVRPMFGDQAIFCDEIMFLWILDNKSYLRDSAELSAFMQRHPDQPCQRLRRVRANKSPIFFRYYDLEDLVKIEEFEPLFFILSGIKNARVQKDISMQLQQKKILRAAERHLKLPLKRDIKEQPR